jgi:phosphoribosylaminoimidazolecarboxamide formyltransferase/IMP cyclohydrolase
MKFAQSNNVACAFEGQLIGLAAGQQSRIDAVKLVSRKVKCWLNRHNAAMIDAFNSDPPGRSKQQRIMDTTAMAADFGDFGGEPDWKPDISFASDAFLPFSDNIEEIAKLPVKYITQAGGSVRDADVIEACDRHGIVMSMTGLRIFTH